MFLFLIYCPFCYNENNVNNDSDIKGLVWFGSWGLVIFLSLSYSSWLCRLGLITSRTSFVAESILFHCPHIVDTSNQSDWRQSWRSQPGGSEIIFIDSFSRRKRERNEHFCCFDLTICQLYISHLMLTSVL